jgi:hypothetical protein
MTNYQEQQRVSVPRRTGRDRLHPNAMEYVTQPGVVRRTDGSVMSSPRFHCLQAAAILAAPHTNSLPLAAHLFVCARSYRIYLPRLRCRVRSPGSRSSAGRPLRARYRGSIECNQNWRDGVYFT